MTRDLLKRIIKEEVKRFFENKKSKPASEVLKLMDNDYEYQQALKIVLSKYKNVNKAELERELDNYI